MSPQSTNLLWGNSCPHNLALLKDGYIRAGGYSKYPPRAKKNRVNVPLNCGKAPDVRITSREAIRPGSREPPPQVKEELRRAIKGAFDSLPAEERPEHKFPLGIADDIGQHAKNLDDTSNNYVSTNAYERLYMRSTPANSQRGKDKNRRIGCRYDDEVDSIKMFFGIELGRERCLQPRHLSSQTAHPAS